MKLPVAQEWIEQIMQRNAKPFQTQHYKENNHPGRCCYPPINQKVSAALSDHRPKFWSWRLGAQADEIETGNFGIINQKLYVTAPIVRPQTIIKTLFKHP